MSEMHDEIVNRVLHGLRDAAPPDGMESRIVSALRQRASAMPSRRRSREAFALWVGSAVVAGVVCALLLTAHRKGPPAMVSHATAASIRAKSDAVILPKDAVRMRARPIARIASASPPPEPWRTISYPAPPMPLTGQEKLLLRLAHKGDPVQLAMLDPVQREARYADERAQVQKFFAPPIQEITHEP